MAKRLHRPSGTTRLVFVRPDGGVSIDIPAVVPVLEPAPTKDDPAATVESTTTAVEITERPDVLAAHIARILAENSGWTHKDTTNIAALPTSRRFRNAWRWIGGGVEVDLSLARAQSVDEVSKQRDRLLLLGHGSDPDTAAALRTLPIRVAADLAALDTAEALEGYTVAWPAGPA